MTTTAQTSPSATLIPTSNPAFDSSIPIDNPLGIGSPMPNIFFSGTSSSLIVAFLSIGLFVITMCGIFGRRRYMRSQRVQQEPVVDNARRKPVVLGKKPTLWDVWADLNIWENSPVQETRWENMTPMTAVLTLMIAPPVELPPLIKPVDPGGSHVLLQTLGYVMSALKRFYFPNPPPPSLAPPPPPPPSSPPAGLDEKEVEPPERDVSDEIDWDDVSSVQVSVIIAMPTEGRFSGGTAGPGSGKEADPEQMELGEFCIGTMAVPWSEGG